MGSFPTRHARVAGIELLHGRLIGLEALLVDPQAHINRLDH